MKLPALTMLGIKHKLNDKADVLFGVTRYDWSVYDRLVVVTPALSRTTITENNYKDTTSFSLGFNYQQRADLELRAGVHVDPTPTNDTDRSFSTPDGDRTWLTLGGSKKLDSSMYLDVAFSHIKVDQSPIDKIVAAGTLFQHTVKATVDASHNLISIGFRKTF